MTLQKMPSSAASRATMGMLVVLLSLNTRRRPAADLGAANTVPTRPDSATTPPSRMATWLQISFTTLIWWVMTTTVMPSFLLMSRISSRI